MLSPGCKQIGDTFHAILRVKESRHSIEQILVPVQVFLLLDQVQFELAAHRFVLQRMVILYIPNQVLAQVA